MTAGEAALSVIAPLVDHRGHAAEAVSSWTRGQTLARDRYEVLVVSNGRDGGAEAVARHCLEAGDRLLRHPSTNELALHDHGARHARSRWLLFTEGHCVAEQTCLEALLDHLEARWPAEAGACLRSTDDGNSHPMARLESRWYRDGFGEWSRDGDWRKVTIRGFAVRRQAYLDVGGFEHELGCFAEVALAATLHARGYRLGYAPAAAVKHYNSTDLGELLAYVREYVQGEVRYRARVPASHFETYFGGPGDVSAASREDRRWAVRAATRSLGAALGRPRGRQSLTMAATTLGLLPGLAATALLGAARDRFAARVAYLWTRLLFATPGLEPDECYRRYRRLWEATGHLARAQADRNAPAGPTGREGDRGVALELRTSELPAGGMIGVHGRETWQGHPFRWTAPLAIIPVRIPPGSYQVVLETRQLRGPDLHGLVDLYVNEHRARPAGGDASRPGQLTFAVDRRMFRPGSIQRLTLVTSRLRARAAPDPRALGLPLFEIAFRPTEAPHA